MIAQQQHAWYRSCRLLISCCLVCATTTVVAPADEPATAAGKSQQTEAGIRCTLVIEDSPQFVFTAVTDAKAPAVTIGEIERDGWKVVVAREALASEKQSGILGHFVQDGPAVRFEPRFSLRPGMRYQVVMPNQTPQRLTFEIPQTTSDSSALPPASVSAIYPTADELPENVLKFYIHFSEPMSRGRAYSHIALFADGKRLESPFLELGEELWDPRQQRFTLFVHPGRIKRGVKPNMDAGPAMRAGTLYTLKVGREWQTAAGRPLEKAVEKNFRVAFPDREQPQPGNWKIEIPAKQTQQPIGLVFDEPLDRALLQRMLQVVDSEGKPVKGDVQVGADHDRWAFKPVESWVPGMYQIIIDTALEDLCGNSIARPFEVQLQANAAATEISRQEVAIEFEVLP